MSVEEHRATLLEVYTSFSLQYAGFVIALGVAAFAELGLLEATGAAGFWPSVLKIVVLASLLATLAGGAMTLVAYLHLRGIVDTLIGKDPQADSPPTLSELEKKYKEWAKERMDKTLIGRFIVGAAVREQSRILVGMLVAFVACLILITSLSIAWNVWPIA